MLWRISIRGEAMDSDSSVCHISKPSILLRSWMSPPAAEYSVGSQSVTCISSMLTRPLVESRGLCTNPAPRIPPVDGMEKKTAIVARKYNKPFRDISAKLTTFHRWEQITPTTPEILETHSLGTIVCFQEERATFTPPWRRPFKFNNW